MNLLELDSARVSLEFSRGEWPAIRARLKRLGDVSRTQAATYELLAVDGAEFILMDEWDQPCLISQSPAGDAILREIADPTSARSPRRNDEGIPRFGVG